MQKIIVAIILLISISLVSGIKITEIEVLRWINFQRENRVSFEREFSALILNQGFYMNNRNLM